MSSESSAEVQLEVEAGRAELVSTLDQLRENLKPGNVVDEVMANAKVTSIEITDRVWQTARANPVAAVLIGVGAAMILGVGQTIRIKTAAKHETWGQDDAWLVEHDPDRWRDASRSSQFEDLKQTASNAKTRLSTQLQTVGSRAARSASQIADSAHELREQATKSASSTLSSAPQGFDSNSGESTMNQYARSRDQLSGTISRLLEEQPLILAAIGVAVGAAIGAAVPSTEAESRLMGDASGSLKARAQELAQQEYAHLKETASATLDDLKQKAADRGVSSENLKGLIDDAGTTVRDAAADVGNHATEKSGLNT